MQSIITKITIFLSFILMGIGLYQSGFKDNSKAWTTYPKPQIAAYASLEQDQEILEELNRQTQFSTYKALDPAFFVKPNIFNTISR